jgi:hypothetical protein
MLTPISNNFTGNIDDLLNHCASVTDEQLDQALELEKAVKHVMEELEMTREEALELIEEIHMNEVQQTVNDLVAKGMLQIVGYDDAGNALYGPTQLGTDTMNQMDNN